MEAVSRLPELSFRTPGFTTMQFHFQSFCKNGSSTAAPSRMKRVRGQSYGYRCRFPSVVTSCHRNGCLSKVFHPNETPKDFKGWIFFPSAQPAKELLAKRVAGDGLEWVLPFFWPAPALLTSGLPRVIGLPVQLSAAGPLLIFRAAFYRSPDISKVIIKVIRCNFF